MTDTLASIADDFFELHFETSPFAASLMGLRSRDAEVPQVSEAAEARYRARYADIVNRAKSVDENDLDATDAATRSMLSFYGRAALDHLDGRMIEMGATAFIFGPQAQILLTLPRMVLAEPAHAQDYITRVRALPSYLEQSLDRFRKGAAFGRSPTARDVRDSIAQIDGYLATSLGEDIVVGPVATATFDGATAYRPQIEAAVAEELRPALRRFSEALAAEILPHGRPDDRCGLRWLDDGDVLYRNALREHTTTDRTAEEIHALGREVIDGLREEYAELGGRALGITDVIALFARLREDSALRYPSGDEAVADAERAVARATEAAPAWFGRLPQRGCSVRPMPEVSAKGMTAAYYQPPAEDGSSEGVYWLNPVGPVVTRYEAEAVAFHEAIPGHHLQIALQQELAHLPSFRRIGLLVTAYQEGWGLYTERLADEMGLYSSDLTRIGMLACDSLRACRLVIDTGVHAFGWSRQEAIDFMLANAAVSEEFAVQEVDRYIAYPGQACGYMIGRLELQRLRRRAEDAFGAGFDVRAFHDAVLGQGSVPLTILEEIVDRWIAGADT